jgi:YHS domain-containing protein
VKALLLAVALAAVPAVAHDHPANHARKGEHRDAPTSFEKQPAPGTWAKCPVSGDAFRVGPETEFATYEGRVYAFCWPDCKPDFDKDPAKYAEGSVR